MKNLKLSLQVFGAHGVILVPILLFSLVTVTWAQEPDWQSVEKVFGRKGVIQGDVFKVTFPRTDLKVRVGEVTVDPGLALTSWIAFKPTGNHAMIMGDLVLLESEVSHVMKKLEEGGVEITALHNHLLHESPRLMYMHFSGHGDPIKLAEAMRSALDVTSTPKAVTQQESQTTADWTKVESILGRTGQHKGLLFQLGVPSAEEITEDATTIPPSMGVATSINIQKVDAKGATTGDFVLLSKEVNPVVKALTDHGITVTAIHSHMLDESPRLFFLHFWGFDDPEKLAVGLRAALSRTHVAAVK